MKDICELALHRVAAWDWQLDRQTWEAFDRLDARRCRDAGLVPHRRLRYRDVSRLPAPAPPRRHCCSAHRIIVCCRWDGNDDGYSSSPFPTFEIGEEASECAAACCSFRCRHDRHEHSLPQQRRPTTDPARRCVAAGSLLVSNAAWVRPTGWSINMPTGFISRTISPAFPDSLFTATLDNVQL